MPYVGNIPAEKYAAFNVQYFTTSATDTYTLDRAVANELDIRLVINNVIQEPGSGKAYTAAGTTLTLSAATAGSDTMYCVYIGKAVQTVNPGAGSVGTTALATNAVTQVKMADDSVGTAEILDTNVTGAKLNDDIISAQSALGAEPADTDEFLVSDAGVLKRVDYSYIKASTVNTAEDVVLWGWEIMATDTAANFTVSAGKLMHGSTLISKTADVTLTFGTAGDWHDGATDSYAGGAGWCYVGVKSNGDVKLLGTNAADKSDVSGNTAGYPFLYWYDSSNYWRVIGAVYVNTSNQCGTGIKTAGRQANCQMTLIAENSNATWTSTSLATLCPKNVLGIRGNIGINGDGVGNDAQVYVSGTNAEIGPGVNRILDGGESKNKSTATDFFVSLYTDQIVYLKTGNANTNYIAKIVGWELP